MRKPFQILITPYLNNRAFVHHGAPEGCQLRAVAPRLAQAEIANGQALAGVVPVGGLNTIRHQISYAGAFGIACTGQVNSVLFFSKQPFDQIDSSSKIAITPDSMTSVRLLYLLFSYRPQRGFPTPTFDGDAVDGELAIGDRALQLKAEGEYPYVLDLSAAWHRQHGLPIVFARWVIRKDAPRELRARVHEWLTEYTQNESTLLDKTAHLDAARAGLTHTGALRYLQQMRTALSVDDLHGQRTYEQGLERHAYFPFLNAATGTVVETQQV